MNGRTLLPHRLLRIASLCVALAFVATHAQTPRDRDDLEARLRSLNQEVQAQPDSVTAYQYRGVVHFMLGDMERAIDDFDRVIELAPYQEARHWQRGICYYYAGEFEKGVAQFELHQTVNSNDVENAVWHFLCNARLEGLEAARAALIPIHYDARVPMKEIWQLFAGSGTVEDVLAAALPEGGDPQRHRQRLCYAHLYLGLYYEAIGQKENARRHINLAANEFAMDNYMGAVAMVHAEILAKPNPGAP